MTANNIIIRSLQETIPPLEIVERKGIGHPDTICDQLAEEVSVALCQYYMKHFGTILHHNVDKALLVGGISEPAFGGGETIQPIEIYMAGRATVRVGHHIVPVEQLAISSIKKWFAGNLRYIDVDNGIKINIKIRPGSSDLTSLIGNGRKTPLANDTSFGTGFFPLSDTEQTVLNIANFLNSKPIYAAFPFVGEDIKVMGVRNGIKTSYTLAVAFVDRYVATIDDYLEKKEQIRQEIQANIGSLYNSAIEINVADRPSQGNIYLTVTGTSAESGDDGQVGRGNRVNGLITPYRPMSLEAVAGKNPVNHVGKLYNLFANNLAQEIVKQKLANSASVYVVSQIGKPINEPFALDIVTDPNSKENLIKQLASDMLRELSEYALRKFNI